MDISSCPPSSTPAPAAPPPSTAPQVVSDYKRARALLADQAPAGGGGQAQGPAGGQGGMWAKLMLEIDKVGRRGAAGLASRWLGGLVAAGHACLLGFAYGWPWAAGPGLQNAPLTLTLSGSCAAGGRQRRAQPGHCCAQRGQRAGRGAGRDPPPAGAAGGGGARRAGHGPRHVSAARLAGLVQLQRQQRPAAAGLSARGSTCASLHPLLSPFPPALLAAARTWRRRSGTCARCWRGGRRNTPPASRRCGASSATAPSTRCGLGQLG